MLELRRTGSPSKALQEIAEKGRSEERRREVGKLSRVDVKGQSSTRNPVAPEPVSYVASLHHQANSIYVDGTIDSIPLKMLLDTGATKTIIRPDLVKKMGKSNLFPTKWRLRTATGEQATASGEIDLNITVGNTSIKHRVLVAEVEDEFILGMDIMRKHGFKLDLKKGVMMVNEEELVLNPREENPARIIITEDVTLPERSESIVHAQLKDDFCEGNVVMLEPQNDDVETGKGIVIGKSLMKANPVILVRIMNINFYPAELKRGTVVGKCSAISSIVRTAKVKKNTSY